MSKKIYSCDADADKAIERMVKSILAFAAVPAAVNWGGERSSSMESLDRRFKKDYRSNRTREKCPVGRGQ